MARRSKLLDFEVDAKDIAAIQKKLARASGKPLYTRLQRANLALGDQLARRMKAAAPRASGTLRRSVKARAEKRKGIGARGRSTTVLVGPTGGRAPHRHLVILGTRNRPSGKRWHGAYTTRKGKHLAPIPGVGPRTRSPKWGTGRMHPNPFVDRASRGFGRKAANLIRKEWRHALR